MKPRTCRPVCQQERLSLISTAMFYLSSLIFLPVSWTMSMHSCYLWLSYHAEDNILLCPYMAQVCNNLSKYVPTSLQLPSLELTSWALGGLTVILTDSV